MQEFIEKLETYLNIELKKITISSPRKKDSPSKVLVRPVMGNEGLFFQVERLVGNQAFHENLDKQRVTARIQNWMEQEYKQLQLQSQAGELHVLVSKKGKLTMREKRYKDKPAEPVTVPFHNRQKKYILPEGTPVPFLVDLGVMSADGRIIRQKYDKFRQINRYLEFVEDILERLPKDRPVSILDFGCGKSYLTFALYYYLVTVKGYQVRITGLDLKKDVIETCSRLSRKYGFENLHFQIGDIASFEVTDRAEMNDPGEAIGTADGQAEQLPSGAACAEAGPWVDMVVSLHACDTATDYALEKAVKWGAKVIFAVPCCQHELNGQIENEILAPIFKYGVIRERIAALMTDAIRADLLEQHGYQTQILEFIDMEHTPKNLMIRAVKTDKSPRSGVRNRQKEELGRCLGFLGADPALGRLLSDGSLDESRYEG